MKIPNPLNIESADPVLTENPSWIQDISGKIATSITSTETTLRKSKAPRNLYEQIFIDTSTGTKKLYIYDSTGAVWYSVTIT